MTRQMNENIRFMKSKNESKCRNLKRKCASSTNRIAMISSALFMMMQPRCLFATPSIGIAIESSDGQIPQHRVRASTRLLKYNSKHPWLASLYSNHRRDQTISEDVVEEDDDNRTVFSRWVNTEDSLDDFDSKNTIVEYPYWIDSVVDVETNDEKDEEIIKQEKIYQPIRIRASLIPHQSSGFHILTPEQRNATLHIVQPAMNTWSQALSVPRIQSNLIIDKDQLYDGQSCGPGVDSGLPSVVVPHEDMTIGQEGTDLMVYLSIGFNEDLIAELLHKDHDAAATTISTEASSTMPPSDKNLDTYQWVNFVNYTGPSSFFSNNNQVDSNATTHTEYNSSKMSSSSSTEEQEPSIIIRSCSGTYLASATYCSTDQFDRPIAGLLHLCIGKDFFKNESLKMNHLTIMHELGHILGFNSQSLAYFRDRETGTPLTDRVDGDVPDVVVECTGIEEGRSNSTIPLPSEKILKLGESRGLRVARIVTPTVRQVVRNRFSCQELEGAELESAAFHPLNGKTSPSCIGDHWERRLFKNDIMNPIIESSIPTTLLSPLTLAYFIDSGWYEVNSSHAYVADTWGRGAGCQFVNDTCINEHGRSDTDFFCSKKLEGQIYDGCTSDMTSKAICGVTEYDVSLPNEFRYFNDRDNFGGFDADLDYCPVYLGTNDGYCKNDPDEVAVKYRLDSFGRLDSRCLLGKSDGQLTPLCVPIACSIDSKSLHVKVDGFWKMCEYSRQILNSWWDEDYVECPDLALACPAFYCPRDCLNNTDASICNSSTGTCSCSSGVDSGLEGSKIDGGNSTDESDCNDVASIPLLEYSSLLEGYGYYVDNSTSLKDDEKNILDHAARMFVKMSVVEVISFVACSLLVVGSFFMISMYVVTILRHRGNLSSFLSRLLSRSNNWRTSMSECSRNSLRDDGRDNKDKIVATVLHDLRVRNAGYRIQPDRIVQNLDVDAIKSDDQAFVEENPSIDQIVEFDQQTILRSQLPPLPGVGRVLAIPGFTFVDDSVQISNQDDRLTVIEGTASVSRISYRSSQVESCSIQSVCTSEATEMPLVRRRR